MDQSLLTQHAWRKLGKPEKSALAEKIATHFTKPCFKFVELIEHEYAEHKEELALFEHQGNRFVFIPGNEAVIGFDPQKFKPTQEQQKSFRDSKKRLLRNWTLKEFLSDFTTPKRQVKIKPMLVEIRPKEAGHDAVDETDPEAATLISGGFSREYVSPGEVGIRFYQSGEFDLWRRREISHAEVVAEIADQGFRLPTSDEWEYLCGGGAATIFRWGSETPSNKYPIESHEVFELNWQPNCFYLSIARDTYDCDIVAEPGIIRGGDGGGFSCAGTGYFIGWLPIATSYIDRSLGSLDETESVDGWWARRVVDI